MRALILDGTTLRLEKNRPPPQPLPNEALIRPLRAGVSEMDVQVSQGLFGFSGVLGHEFVGVVEACEGDGSQLLGKRVVGSSSTVCGECDLCQTGLREHCRNRTLMGQSGRDGCFSDRFTLPITNLALVPESVDDDRAIFAQLVGASIQVVRQLTIEGRPFITVLGDGPLGLIMVQVLAKLNATVRLIGRYSEKMALCERWGIKHRHADDIGRRNDQDIVVDCSGSSQGFELATKLVRPRGKIIVKTLLADWNRTGAGVDLTDVVMNEIVVHGSRSGPISEAIGMIEREEIDVVSLIGRRMSLNDGPTLVSAASQTGMLRVLVDF